MVVERLEPRLCRSATYFVSPDGDDAADGSSPTKAWRHVQHAFDVAPAGSTVNVLAGRYREHLALHVNGSAEAGYTTFRAEGAVILDGAGRAGVPIVSIATASYVKLVGFDVVNFTTRHGGAAILFEGSGDHVQFLGNTVHHTRGFEASAIGVYGTNAKVPIRDLTIDGNTIHDCRPADSETLTLNGNVTGFAVTNNVVRDTNNIGIVFIGGEGTSVDPATGAADPSTDTTRDGTCANNHVTRAHSNYGDGYGAGIYVDGGRDILIERNTVDHCDLGIEVGCEHAGRTTTGVLVRSNLLYENDRAGLAFGGYAAKVGRSADCRFLNNTIVHNQVKPDGNGEIWFQLADRCTVANNLVVVGKQGIATSYDGDAGVVGAGNTSDHNLFFGTAHGGRLTFGWKGETYKSAAEYTAATGQDAHAVLADPKLVKPTDGDVHLAPGSPAADAGDPTTADALGPLDVYGRPRVVSGRVDIGAATGG